MEKKLISLVLTVLMIMSILPMSAFAAQNLPESEHPYADNEKQKWTYEGKDDVSALLIKFSEETEVEDGYDFIYIYDGDGKPYCRYTGTELSGETIYLEGNGFTIVLETDGSNTSYGFKVENVKEIDSETYNCGIIGDEYCNITADNETRTITFSPSSKNDGTHPLNFDIVRNVYWVDHVVIDEGFTGESPDLNCFRFANRFDICDGIYFNKYNIIETYFYEIPSNWEDGSLYISNYLVDMKKGTSVKNGTKYICDNAIDGDCVIIPDIVSYIGEDNYPRLVICTEGSYAQSWAKANDIPCKADRVRVKFKSPIINSGTPLSSAIEVYKLTDDFEWERESNYSASGYKANQTGIQTVTIKTGEYSTTVTICISNSDEQYINFSDPVLFKSLIDNGVDSNGDGIISVDEMESYDGYIGLDGVGDVAGLEYASQYAEIDCHGCTAPAKDILSLQSYSNITMLENAKRRIDVYSRFSMGDYRSNINYSSSNPDVAEIDHGEYQDMICTGKSGTAEITVTCEGIAHVFKVTVESPDKPMGEKTDNIPELLSKYSYNADGSFYIGNRRVRFDSKVLMSTFYPARNYYYGTYYLTEDGNLWTLNEGARFPRKIGTDFAKITTFDDYSGSGLALDKNGNCWELNDFELIATDVKDISGMFFLTKDNELYRCYDTSLNNEDFDTFKNVYISSDVRSIVKTGSYGQCIYNKKDCTTYQVGTGINYYFGIGNDPKMICADKFATDVLSYLSSYYYIDEAQTLWELRSDGVSDRVADNIVQLSNEGYGFLDKDGRLYSIRDLTRDNGKYELGAPLLTNVKKLSDRFYLDKNNNLYTSVYNYGYSLCWGIREGEKPVKIMTNVVDFTEYYYSNVIFTRKDGSVWTWEKPDNEDYYEKLLDAYSERDKIITDEKTGIEIEFNDQFDKNVKLEANEVSDMNSLKLLNDKFGKVEAKMYDISVKKNGVKVQPNGSVTVSIPVPENFSPYFHVCSIGADGKSITTLARSVGGGYATFTTDHLGRFAIVQEVNAELGDVNADGVINSADALRVLQHSVDIIQLQDAAAKRADVNEDKIINSNDALNILRYSVGLITDFSEIK